jgi:hypothetical protein
MLDFAVLKAAISRAAKKLLPLILDSRVPLKAEIDCLTRVVLATWVVVLLLGAASYDELSAETTF